MPGHQSLTTIVNRLVRELDEEELIDTDHISDGYHTFQDLYKQRLYLTAALFNAYPELAYKTRKHVDGSPCFDGKWFLVVIETPEGQYSYHYENRYWNLFKIPELKKAKGFDGHTSKDVRRLISLPIKPKTFYTCDHRNICGDSPSCGITCNHTSDIEHAVHFECIKDGTFWEKEDE